MKSFVAKDGSGDPPSPGRNGERHFHGEQRSNETHSSTTDPEAKLAKKGKGKEAKLAYTGNVMTENRNGFVVEAELRQVSGMVERETAKDMIVHYSPGRQAHHRGCRQGLRYDTADFVSDMRDFNDGSSGAGGLTHLLGRAVPGPHRHKVVHIPFRGGAPSTAAVVSGEVDFSFANMTDGPPAGPSRISARPSGDFAQTQPLLA